MDKGRLDRTIGLIGEDKVKLISSKKIVVFGLGGVGGTALECLARSGFNNFVIVDFDTVSSSNLNRQILYTSDDIGLSKVKVAMERVKSIGSDINIQYINSNVKDLDFSIIKNADFIVDAIDDVPAKIKIAQFALRNNIPYLMSLGMANRLDPSKVQVLRLDKTTKDPLAKKIRYEIRKNGLDTSKIMTVYSSEEPVKDNSKLHSMMMVPSSAGLNIAYFIISYFISM